jgi:hypothetical protein
VSGPFDYIPDWTEQDGPYEENEYKPDYSDEDELRDREEECENENA